MSAQHTPGPWATGGIFDPLGDAPTTNVWGPTPEGKQSGQLICQRVSLADGLLIAAAPELLAALIRCEANTSSHDAVGRQARAAIAKATGSAS